jgi:nucleoid-associated protein YgaU
MWVDKGLNLEKALAMLKQAVAMSPDAGFIVDSLGWAEYRLGRYEDAVETLERAVSLRADDPTMNDHLGDAYWRVGRKREAYFQWDHAREFKPEKDLLQKIEQKLRDGLVDGVKEIQKSSASESIEVGPGESLWTIAARIYGDAGQYPRLLEANKDLIANPNLLVPGMRLTIPANGTN